jgi:hypothetical protein
MKSKSPRKFKQPQVDGSKSRDKVRKLYSDFRAAEKSGKSRPPLAERRAGTRAGRHKSKGILKQIQVKLNA